MVQLECGLGCSHLLQKYPVKEDSVSELEKTFKAEKRGYYCLMWSNPGIEDVKLDYHFKTLNASAVSE